MSNDKTTYLCIGCPLGCRLEVDESEAGEVLEIRGFSCKRGKEYALQEHTDPRRIVTTTIAITGGLLPRLPVRSKGAVPKNKVKAICTVLHNLETQAPVSLGKIIVANILDTGVDIVASRDMELVP